MLPYFLRDFQGNNMLRRLCLTAGLLVLGLNVSAVAAPLPMPIASNLPIEIVLNQQELAVDVPNTASAVGAQFGLIGALIGSAIANEQAKKAEAAVVPLRDMLVEYRFDERLKLALLSKLASDGISPNPAFTVLKTPWDAVDAQNSQQVPLQALVITPRYSIDSGFSQLSVQLTAQVVDRQIKSNGKIKAKSRFFRTYAFRFPLSKEKGSENGARWQAIGKDRLVGILDEGIVQATDMLVYDMSAKGREEWAMTAKSQTVKIKGEAFDGVMVRQTPDWVWLRNGWSHNQSMQGYEPVSEQDTIASVTTTASASAAPTAAVQTPDTTNAKTADLIQPQPAVTAGAGGISVSQSSVGASATAATATPPISSAASLPSPNVPTTTATSPADIAAPTPSASNGH